MKCLIPEKNCVVLLMKFFYSKCTLVLSGTLIDSLSFFNVFSYEWAHFIFFFWFVSFSFLGRRNFSFAARLQILQFFSRTLSRWENETDGKTWFWLTARVLHEVDARIKRASSTLTFLYCRKKERNKKPKRLDQNSLVFGNSPFLAISFSSPKPFDP